MEGLISRMEISSIIKYVEILIPAILTGSAAWKAAISQAKAIKVQADKNDGDLRSRIEELKIERDKMNADTILRYSEGMRADRAADSLRMAALETKVEFLAREKESLLRDKDIVRGMLMEISNVLTEIQRNFDRLAAQNLEVKADNKATREDTTRMNHLLEVVINQVNQYVKGEATGGIVNGTPG